MYGRGKSLAYIMDLDKRQMTTDQVVFYGGAKDVYLENGNILATCASNNDDDNLTIQRFTLK
jgi:hypothetical protein